MTRSRRMLLFAAVALAAVVAGAVVARHWRQPSATGPVLTAALLYGTPRPVPDFELLDQRAATFDRQRLHGRWSLLFFGFTHCPDVCPGTLTTLATVARSLHDLPAALRPQLVLVSVDPARDTPAVLAEYTAYFDPNLIGVTGTAQAIESFARALGVAMQKGPVVDGTYTVDHTAAIFLVNPQAELAAVMPTPHVVATIAADYRAIVQQAR